MSHQQLPDDETRDGCPCCGRFDRPKRQREAIARLLQAALDHCQAPITDKEADGELFDAIIQWGVAICGEGNCE